MIPRNSEAPAAVPGLQTATKLRTVPSEGSVSIIPQVRPNRTVQKGNPTLAWALRYALQGLAVIPCNGKVPLTEHGYHDATTDLETIGAWWQRWPSANIGLPMAPNGLVAIDVDPRNGGTLAALSLPAELKTWRATTGGGGQHIIFAAPGAADLPGTLGPGLDLKYHGYVIVSPSVHPGTGKRYNWLPSQSPWDLDPAPVPAELLARMIRQNAPQAPNPAPVVHEHAQTRPDGATVPLDVVESALRSICLLYTSPSPRDRTRSRMPSSA